MTVSDFQREQIAQLSRRMSAKEISSSLNIPEKTIIRMQNTRCSIPYTRKKKEKIKIKTIQQSAEFICRVLSELRSGDLDNKSATTQCYILSILIRALSESELEQRIRKIEEEICRRKKAE